MKSIHQNLLSWFMTALTITAAVSASAEPLPPGASKAFTSSDPVVVQARKLVADGSFAQAEKMLKEDQTAGDTDARAELVEVMRRVRRDYPMDFKTLLGKVKETRPKTTAKDLQRWLDAGYVTLRKIDGEVKIFSSEPRNLYIFSKEARGEKETERSKRKSAWSLTGHVEEVVKAAEKSGQIEVLPMIHSATYTVTVPGGTKGMKQGSVLRVWVPMPQEYRQQKNVKLLSTSPEYKTLAPSAMDHGLVEGAAMRTIYFEKTVDSPSKDQVFKVSYEFDSYAYCPNLKDSEVQPLPSDFPQEYLAERAPHIMLTPEVKKLAASIVGDETNSLARARKIFHWISENIPWQYEDEYSTIPSISEKVLNIHRGDCGVQSIAFQTLARASGVPTRWQSGWETKPSSNGNHDWCEFYCAPWGWLPCDPCYGPQKKSDDPKVVDFFLGHQDSYRIIFNLDYGRQFDPPKKTFRSDPMDSQLGEVELDGRNLFYDEFKHKMDFTAGPDKL